MSLSRERRVVILDQTWPPAFPCHGSASVLRSSRNDRVTYALTSFRLTPGERIADSEIFPSPRQFPLFNGNKIPNIVLFCASTTRSAKMHRCWSYVANEVLERKKRNCRLRPPNRPISKNFAGGARAREEREREREQGGAITGESGPDENKNRV